MIFASIHVQLAEEYLVICLAQLGAYLASLVYIVFCACLSAPTLLVLVMALAGLECIFLFSREFLLATLFNISLQQ